jgi:DNA-binding Xre family transcriptional regulator
MNEPVKIKNKLTSIITKRENEGFKFIPDRYFFKRVGIGQKRWPMLLRNEKPINTDELANLCTFFDCSIYDLIEL